MEVTLVTCMISIIVMAFVCLYIMILNIKKIVNSSVDILIKNEKEFEKVEKGFKEVSSDINYITSIFDNELNTLSNNIETINKELDKQKYDINSVFDKYKKLNRSFKKIEQINKKKNKNKK